MSWRAQLLSALLKRHTVGYDPLIKSHLASRNWGLIKCKSGHVTLEISSQQSPRTPPSGWTHSRVSEEGAEGEVEPLSSNLGPHKTFKTRLWLWLEPLSARTSFKPLRWFHPSAQHWKVWTHPTRQCEGSRRTDRTGPFRAMREHFQAYSGL